MSQAYQVTVESDEVLVRFSREIYDAESVARFLDYLELEAIRKRSQLTQEEADALADEVDRAGWERLKGSFVQA